MTVFHAKILSKYLTCFDLFLLIDCHDLGMEDYNITNSRITASSQQHLAPNARLNFKPANSRLPGAWCAAINDANQPWLQVDFANKVTLTQVATQGRFYDGDAVGPSLFHGVKTFSLNYSLDEGMHFKAYEQFDDVKVKSEFIKVVSYYFPS